MIDRRQMILIHEYQRLAGLSDREYREILKRATGARSCKQLDQPGYERAMAALEAVLWARVEEAVVKDPKASGRIMSRNYWRNRLPARGSVNSRLKWKLQNYFAMLADYLPEHERTPVYLAGMIAHAGGIRAADVLDNGQIAWGRVPSKAAHLAIEAMKDRMTHAVARLHTPAEEPEPVLPF